MKKILLVVSTFFISLIIWLGIYGSLPEKLVMHFESNTPTEYASKSFMFAMFMLITFVLLLALYVFLIIDNKNPNKQKVNKPIAIIGVIFVVGLNVIYILNVNNESFDTSKVFIIFIGLIFIIIGNYLPTLKYNLKVGIRNFASTKNEKSWNKIQRFSGNLFVLSGILISFTSLMPSLLYSIILSLLIISFMLLFVQTYSNKIHS